MLITSETPALTVRRISAHLGVREWSIARELKLGAAGQEGRLRGQKVTGAGRVGQGGQWEVDLDAYLDWLGMERADREVIGDDGLPELHSFERVAVNEGLTTAQVASFVEVNGLDYLRVGQRRYFSHYQRIRFETLLRAKTSGSR